MKSFLSYHYWFNLRPGSLEGNSQKYFIGLVILFLISTFIVGYIKSRKKNFYSRIFKKLYSFFLTNFFIGLAFLFFTYEAVPFLSARFWFLLWLIGMGIWIYFIIKELIKIPKVKEEIQKEKEFKKYIP